MPLMMTMSFALPLLLLLATLLLVFMLHYCSCRCGVELYSVILQTRHVVDFRSRTRQILFL